VIEHISQLCGRDRHHAVGRRRPDEAAALQSLGVALLDTKLTGQPWDKPEDMMNPWMESPDLDRTCEKKPD
jgi:hypothetical protein